MVPPHEHMGKWGFMGPCYGSFKTNFGYVGMVMIGMYDISSIKLLGKVNDLVDIGEELGNFAYGGSEIILFIQKGKA